MDRLLLFTLLFSAPFSQVEGGTDVFINPEITNVILDTPANIECYTQDSGYSSLTFNFNSPPGVIANWKTSSVTNRTGGGITINASIVITRELNKTVAICYAAGQNNFGQSQAATLIAQEIPNKIDGLRVCKLGRRVFFSWNPVQTLKGIDVYYRICDNCKKNNTINVPHYSIQLDDLTSDSYRADVTVILNTSAVNQVASGTPYHLTRTITDEQSLNLSETSAYKDNKDNVVEFHFNLKLDDLNDDCNFNNFTDRKWIVCNNNTGCNKVDADIEYRQQQLTSRAELSVMKHRFKSRLSFSYLGENVETENVTTSTHDVQEIKRINQSCFYIDIINGSEIIKFHIQIVSSKGEKYKLNVPRQNVTLCSPIVYNGTHNIHFSEGSGLYNIYAYDDQTEMKNGQPAAEFNNLKVSVETTERAPSSPSSSSGIVAQLVYFLMVAALASMLM